MRPLTKFLNEIGVYYHLYDDEGLGYAELCAITQTVIELYEALRENKSNVVAVETLIHAPSEEVLDKKENRKK